MRGRPHRCLMLGVLAVLIQVGAVCVADVCTAYLVSFTWTTQPPGALTWDGVTSAYKNVWDYFITFGCPNGEISNCHMCLRATTERSQSDGSGPYDFDS